MIRLAVFGQPIAKSLSPRIHGLFAKQFGLPVEYSAIESTAETFSEQVAELAREGGRGCNITLPFKNHAWRLAARCSDDANRAEAANTLVFTPGEWYADNTDGGGLVGDLEQNCGITLKGRKICLLGAGGAAGGVLAALLRAGPESITVANRTRDKAVDLAARHGDLGNARGTGLDEMAGLGPFDLVINATSAGHGGTAPALPASLFGADAFCYDMNYGAASAPLRQFCGDIDVPYADGLGMLVGQAALSFAIWTGEKPDTAPVLEALRAAAGK